MESARDVVVCYVARSVCATVLGLLCGVAVLLWYGQSLWRVNLCPSLFWPCSDFVVAF